MRPGGARRNDEDFCDGEQVTNIQQLDVYALLFVKSIGCEPGGVECFVELGNDGLQWSDSSGGMIPRMPGISQGGTSRGGRYMPTLNQGRGTGSSAPP